MKGEIFNSLHMPLTCVVPSSQSQQCGAAINPSLHVRHPPILAGSNVKQLSRQNAAMTKNIYYV